jgi:hypothetical protein
MKNLKTINSFLLKILVVILFLLSTYCTEKSAKQLEQELLTGFLTPPENNKISRQQIQYLLFDIKYKGKTTGRAIHLGDHYFLTAYHVVEDRNDKIFLIHQYKRGKPKKNSMSFEILFYDKNSDLALIRSEKQIEKKGKPLLYLSITNPEPESNVSKFLGLIGSPREERFEFEYSGKDFYYPDDAFGVMGTMIMHEYSLLYEIEGRTLKYHEPFFKKAFSEYSGNEITRTFTTILTYNGDSGSGIFTKLSEDKFVFTGIITHSYGINFEFDTPEHPLGYKRMQQAGGIYSHRVAIERLIQQYLLFSMHIN